MEPKDSWRGLATEESIIGLVNLLTSNNPSERATLKATLTDTAGNILYPAGNPTRLSATVTRPANQLDYAIGDNIGAYTTNIKQKEIITLSGEAGIVNMSIVGIANRNITFDTSLNTTAANFVTAYADDFLPTIVVTNLNNTIIFESAIAGVPFEAPIINEFESDLDGVVTNVVANRAAVKQKETITLTGQYGSAVISGTGGLSKTVTFIVSTSTTASIFVADNAAEYLTKGIILTNNNADLIFEANVAGVTFVTPIISGETSTLTGTLVHTIPNDVDIAQVETLTISGTSGVARITAAGGLTKTITYLTSPTLTAAEFVTTNSADYVAQDIAITSNGPDLIFTAMTPGTGFTAPVITTLTPITGTLVSTQVNITAVAKVDKLNLSGTTGYASITNTGGLTIVLDATSGLESAASTFVALNSAAYAAQGITITSNYKYIWFSAIVPGTNFTSPTITNLDILKGTIAHTTANGTISAIPIIGASTNLGGGGTIKGFKLETNDVTFAEKVVRVWLLNAVPTGVVGDNVAFIINFTDASKRLAVPYIDVTFNTLLVGSDSVIGKVDTEIQYVCTSTDTNLYVLLQTLSTVVAPKSAGVFQLDINVLKLT